MKKKKKKKEEETVQSTDWWSAAAVSIVAYQCFQKAFFPTVNRFIKMRRRLAGKEKERIEFEECAKTSQKRDKREHGGQLFSSKKCN